MRFGEWVRERRKAAGLSLRAAAAKMAVSHVYLGEVERGRKAMSSPLRHRQLATLLGVTPSEVALRYSVEEAFTTCPTCGRRMKL